MIETLSLVGYGDGFAASFIGRILTVFVCLLGVALMAFQIIMMSSRFKLTGKEATAY